MEPIANDLVNFTDHGMKHARQIVCCLGRARRRQISANNALDKERYIV